MCPKDNESKKCENANESAINCSNKYITDIGNCNYDSVFSSGDDIAKDCYKELAGKIDDCLAKHVVLRLAGECTQTSSK